MIVPRINPNGILFHINPSGTKTMVSSGSKTMLMNLPYNEFLQCWHDWQMKGEFVQDAFPKLTAPEREFLMTTITPEEWKAIFEGKRNVED